MRHALASGAGPTPRHEDRAGSLDRDSRPSQSCGGSSGIRAPQPGCGLRPSTAPRSASPSADRPPRWSKWPSATPPMVRVAGRQRGPRDHASNRVSRLGRGAPSHLDHRGLGAPHTLDQRCASGLGVGVLRALAPLVGGHLCPDLGHVLTAAAPRRLAALLAPDRHAHGRSLPFVVMEPATCRPLSQ